MLRSSGPGQTLRSLVANRVLVIRLVHWLGWVFENKERKKEKNPHGRREKKQELYSTGTAPVLQYSRNVSRSRNTKRNSIAGLSRLRHPARSWKLKFSIKDTKSFCNGSWPRARWPMRLVLVWATLRLDVDVTSAHLSSFARSIFPCAALC